MRADVVIVGAGIAGLALARELRLLGCDAAILDRCASPPAEATARSAWMLRTDVHHPAFEPIVRLSASIWRSGELGGMRATGGFLIGQGDRDDVADRVPSARGRGEWRPGDGLVDASAALRALAPAPGRLFRGTDVPSLHARRGGPAARVVVNAAGAWAGVLGALPLRPLLRHVVLVSCSTVAADAPFVWDVPEAFYFRPHEAGLMISACDEVPSAPGERSVDPAAVQAALAAARRLQPGLGDLRPAGAWSGQRTFAEDRLPVVGWDPRDPSVFHLAGLGGHGVTTGPALARLSARAILSGPGGEPAELLPFSPSRLALA